MTETGPIFSRRQPVDFTPPGSPRTYSLAPLTYLQRQTFLADMARHGASYPSQSQMLAAVRAALAELAPDNLAELLAAVDAFEQLPDDPDLLGGDAPGIRARMTAIEAAIGGVPVYANLVAQRSGFLGLQPWFAAAHALRGWDGPDLPPFVRVAGRVPDDVLEALHELGELSAVGWRATDLMQPGPSAAKNSEPPSRSSETPAPSPAA